MTHVLEFAHARTQRRKISIVTAYDAGSARLIAGSSIDAILVGDSVAMVVHGHPTTLTATVDLMAIHTRAVAAGAGGKFVIADLPFLAYRKGLPAAMDAVGVLVASGAQAVKLEGIDGHEEVVRHIVESGVPVMGHVGLTPQSVHRLGGFRLQGRTDTAADVLVRQAQTLEDLGCFAVVIECVPAIVGTRITAAVQIPTIGIGAGPDTDGQVMVLPDLLGLTATRPRFVRPFADGEALFTTALNHFDAAVKSAAYPSESECYR
jgi:3-methyl-2-oxobutanoate hydroxymethyltransferase